MQEGALEALNDLQEEKLEKIEAIVKTAHVKEEQAELLEELNHHLDVHENTDQEDNIEEGSSDKEQINAATIYPVDTPTEAVPVGSIVNIQDKLSSKSTQSIIFCLNLKKFLFSQFFPLQKKSIPETRSKTVHHN